MNKIILCFFSNKVKIIILSTVLNDS